MTAEQLLCCRTKQLWSIMRCAYALNTEGLKAGSVYALNRKYALNNEVHLTTRVYGMGKESDNYHFANSDK